MLLLDGALIIKRSLPFCIHVPIVTVFLIEQFPCIVFIINRTVLAQEQLVFYQFQIGADIQRCLTCIVLIRQFVQPIERITVTLAVAIIRRPVVEERFPGRFHTLHTLEKVCHVVVIQFRSSRGGKTYSSFDIQNGQYLIIPVQRTAEPAVFRAFYRSVFGIIP